MVDKPKNTFQPTYDLANHFTYYLWKFMLIFIILTVLSCAVWTGLIRDFENTRITKWPKRAKLLHFVKLSTIAKLTELLKLPKFILFLTNLCHHNNHLIYLMRSDWLTKNNKPENPFQNFDVAKKLLTRKKK